MGLITYLLIAVFAILILLIFMNSTTPPVFFLLLLLSIIAAYFTSKALRSFLFTHCESALEIEPVEILEIMHWEDARIDGVPSILFIDKNKELAITIYDSLSEIEIDDSKESQCIIYKAHFKNPILHALFGEDPLYDKSLTLNPKNKIKNILEFYKNI